MKKCNKKRLTSKGNNLISQMQLNKTITSKV